MTVVAVVNQKGGVGKTTVALGLASAARHAKKRVLVIDLDPQSNATTGLGLWDVSRGMESVLGDGAHAKIDDVIVTSPWGSESENNVDLPAVSVAPATPGLAQAEHRLALDVIGAQDNLASALQQVSGSYDAIIIDCPPSLGLLTINALFAADRAVIVAEPAAWSSDGVAQILQNIERIAERRGGKPDVGALVINRLGRTRDGEYWYRELLDTYPHLVTRPPIKLRAAVAESAAQSMPIHELTRDGAAEAATEFSRIAARIFEWNSNE